MSYIHSHNTRYASNLNFHVPRVRPNYGKHTFINKFAITKTWEEIPTKIMFSYHKFKKEYRRILLGGGDCHIVGFLKVYRKFIS